MFFSDFCGEFVKRHAAARAHALQSLLNCLNCFRAVIVGAKRSRKATEF